MRNLCVGVFGEKDTFTNFEPEIRNHYEGIYHFSGDYTPTVDKVREWHVPRVKES